MLYFLRLAKTKVNFPLNSRTRSGTPLGNETQIAIISNETDIGAMLRLYFERHMFKVYLIHPKSIITKNTHSQLSQSKVIIIKIYPESDIISASGMCKLLRQDDLLAKLPIVILSTDKKGAISAGATIWRDIVFDIESLHADLLDLVV